MNDKRWTLDPEINDYLAGMVPPKEIIERLIVERGPIEAAAPKTGEQAPDFAAERISDTGERTGEYARLADFHGRPFALLFGSYTCPVYRGQIARFNEIYAELKDRFQFLTIYIREAHPEDGWQVEINHAQGVTYNQPKTADERVGLARVCRNRHGIEMPMAMDNMDNDAEKSYSGAPERLYLIDAHGIVAYRSERGPFALQAIENWYQALKNMTAPLL